MFSDLTRPGLTIFVPTNDAVAKVQQFVGDDAFRSLMDSKQTVTSFIKFHVLPQRYDRDGLVRARTVQPVLGGTLRIQDAGGTLTVTDELGGTANVVCGNIPTLNATVFIVDHMLLPQGFSLLRPKQPDNSTCAPSPNAYNNAVICTATASRPS